MTANQKRPLLFTHFTMNMNERSKLTSTTDNDTNVDKTDNTCMVLLIHKIPRRFFLRLKGDDRIFYIVA